MMRNSKAVTVLIEQINSCAILLSNKQTFRALRYHERQNITKVEWSESIEIMKSIDLKGFMDFQRLWVKSEQTSALVFKSWCPLPSLHQAGPSFKNQKGDFCSLSWEGWRLKAIFKWASLQTEDVSHSFLIVIKKKKLRNILHLTV